jgi:hypothetical protein
MYNSITALCTFSYIFKYMMCVHGEKKLNSQPAVELGTALGTHRKFDRKFESYLFSVDLDMYLNVRIEERVIYALVESLSS